jgi:uncharacterized damage-inducible protein DinB
MCNTMKNYFIRLFEYDRFANKKILETVRKTNNPQTAVQLMGHLLAAQQRWLSRCLQLSVADNDLFPQRETIPFEDLIDDSYQQWISFLSSLTPADMDQIIIYKNTAGTEYSNTITEILTQVINHGTHHRAQIGQQLKIAGAETLPITDFIFFIRN